MVWAIIISLLVILDQITKFEVRRFLDLSESIPVIDRFFYISNRHNKGAAWSFLADKDWGIYLLAGISFIASIVIIVLIAKSKNNRFKLIMSLICAGSIGNLIDRVFFKGVTDFLDFRFWTYIFPTFNVADMLVVCGTILLVAFILFDSKFLNDFVIKEKAN